MKFLCNLGKFNSNKNDFYDIVETQYDFEKTVEIIGERKVFMVIYGNAQYLTVWACSILSLRSLGGLYFVIFSKIVKIESTALSPIAWREIWSPALSASTQ